MSSTILEHFHPVQQRDWFDCYVFCLKFCYSEFANLICWSFLHKGLNSCQSYVSCTSWDSETSNSQIKQLMWFMTKPTKWPVRPAKTQISLGIRPVWSVFAVCMKKHWALNYTCTYWVYSEDWAHKSFCWFSHVVAHYLAFYENKKDYQKAFKWYAGVIHFTKLWIYTEQLKKLDT